MPARPVDGGAGILYSRAMPDYVEGDLFAQVSILLYSEAIV